MQCGCATVKALAVATSTVVLMHGCSEDRAPQLEEIAEAEGADELGFLRTGSRSLPTSSAC